MKYPFKTLLLIGVSLEVIILLVSYFTHPETGDTFRYAARYSGRLSALVFLMAFYLYATNFPTPVATNQPLPNFIKLFAVLHVIHFGFLAASVYLNELPLEAVKVAGGALAYGMIVIAPFKLHQMKTPIQLVYFYYVSLVMMLTWVARIKGEFVGAEPYWMHYVGLGVFAVCALLFGRVMWRGRKGLIV